MSSSWKSQKAAIKAHTLSSGVTISASNLQPIQAGYNLSMAGLTAIPGLATTNLQTLSIDEMLNQLTPEVKKYEVYESPEDVLALSLTWKRLRESNNREAGRLLDRVLFRHVSDEDREKAQVIRNYYSKKFLTWSLKNIRLTPYRTDLQSFVNNKDGKIVKENMLGLAVKLPDFYDYDLELDSVRGEVIVKQGFSNEGIYKVDPKHVSSLVPLKKLHRKTKSTDFYEYWLKNEVSDCAVLITIVAKNPLEHIWEHFFNNSKVLHLQGPLIRKTRDDFEYYSITDWKLTNI